MSKGRTRALLGYGTGQFIVYGLAVLAVVHWGIVAVAIAAASVHTVFMFVAYALILRGTAERPLRRLWEDLSPALVSCAGLAAVALPLSIGMTELGVRPLLWLALLGVAGGCAYAVTLRICFLTTWRAQLAILRRVVPLERRLGELRAPCRRTGGPQLGLSPRPGRRSPFTEAPAGDAAAWRRRGHRSSKPAPAFS